MSRYCPKFVPTIPAPNFSRTIKISASLIVWLSLKDGRLATGHPSINEMLPHGGIRCMVGQNPKERVWIRQNGEIIPELTGKTPKEVVRIYVLRHHVQKYMPENTAVAAWYSDPGQSAPFAGLFIG